MEHPTMTLEELALQVTATINSSPGLHDVWVTAETSDLRRSVHCYLELIQKHPDTGEPVARMRATIWRSALSRIDATFSAATGSRLESGMKIRVLVNVAFHPAYGLSLNITDIDPAYTLGDLMRLRMEILGRLKKEGILECNRCLPIPELPQRIAVISAEGAAGYGDFLHQLYTNQRHLRFHTRLFPAMMQGAKAPRSIIDALEAVAAQEDDWDCVVIIRGGGATSDLAAFENYDLAANIALFPLPVIIGIGHERDVTVLDYVANMRVKTPTAAAEWLIARGEEALDTLDGLASAIHHTASALLSANREQLAYFSATLPFAPLNAVASARKLLDRSLIAVTDMSRRRLTPENEKLSLIAERLKIATAGIVERRQMRLNSIGELIDVLSPVATLKRGYSITRVAGRAVTSTADIPSGSKIVTTLADGEVTSTAL